MGGRFRLKVSLDTDAASRLNPARSDSILRKPVTSLTSELNKRNGGRVTT
jgi:hypothetical protein